MHLSALKGEECLYSEKILNYLEETSFANKKYFTNGGLENSFISTSNNFSLTQILEIELLSNSNKECLEKYGINKFCINLLVYLLKDLKALSAIMKNNHSAKFYELILSYQSLSLFRALNLEDERFIDCPTC